MKISERVVKTLNELTQDWDILDQRDEVCIRPETKLMEQLGFESIDVVQLVVALEKEFDKKGMPFEQLFMSNGVYVDDITVSDITLFIESQL